MRKKDCTRLLLLFLSLLAHTPYYSLHWAGCECVCDERKNPYKTAPSDGGDRGEGRGERGRAQTTPSPFSLSLLPPSHTIQQAAMVRSFSALVARGRPSTRASSPLPRSRGSSSFYPFHLRLLPTIPCTLSGHDTGPCSSCLPCDRTRNAHLFVGWWAR